MCDYCFLSFSPYLSLSLCASCDAAYAIFIYGQRHGVFCRFWSAWQYILYAGHTFKCIYSIYVCIFYGIGCASIETIEQLICMHKICNWDLR